MLRKVNRIGPSTLMVSLPSKWVRDMGIRKGDDLEVFEEDHMLKIGHACVRKENKFVMALTKETPLRRCLNALYMNGCDEISLSADERLDISAIESEIEPLIGYEIVQHTSNSCVIRDVAYSLSTEFDHMLRRIFLINMTMGEEGLAAIKSGEHASLARVSKMEKTNNRFTSYCARTLNKHGYPDHRRLHIMIKLVGELEKVADDYRDLCAQCRRTKATLDNETLAIFEGVNSLFKMLYELHYNFVESRVNDLKIKRKEIEGLALDMLKRRRGDPVALHHFLSLVRVMAHIEYLICYQ